MGSACLKAYEDDPMEVDIDEVKECLSLLLQQLNPDDLLNFAIEDTEIYELCEEYSVLRQACIIAAVRRYHVEKFFFEEVHNRTAPYMVLLDRFVALQEEEEMKEMEIQDEGMEEVSNSCCFPWWNFPNDFNGGAGSSGAATTTAN